MKSTVAAVAGTMLLLAGVLSGCTIPQADNEFIRVFSVEPETGLITTTTNEIGGGRILDLLYTGLYRYDLQGKSQPAMVDKLSTPDNQHYTITIKKGWKFTDGTEVKAHNYVDAWNFGAYTPNAQKQQSFFAAIKGYDQVAADKPTAKTMSGLKVVDDYTFTVELSQPTFDFRNSLGFTPFKPLPDVAFKEGIEKFGQHPIGNGPYTFKTWQHNQRIDLVANPDYPGPNKAHNKGLSFTIYNDAETAYTDLLSGNLDDLDPLPPSSLFTYHKELGDKAVDKPTAQLTWIAIPYRAPHFSGEEGRLRRQAISKAIDRAEIAKTIFRGTRIPAREFTAPTLPGYNPNIPGADVLDYDPAAARKLWDQANRIAPWSGSFIIASNYDSGNKEWIEATANSIKNALHIDARGQSVATFKQIRQEINEGSIKTAFRSAWYADYPSMLEFLEPDWKTGGGSNDPRYSNPEFDAKLNEAEAQVKPEDSYRVTNEAQEILLRDLPGIPMHYWKQTAGFSPTVTGTISWNGTPNYEDMTKS